MRSIVAGVLVVLLGACGASSSQPSASVSSEEPSASPSSAAASVAVSVPEFVQVTFRLTLTGTMPPDAAFALETGQVGQEGGAIYLCSYYGGWPVCDSNQGTYEQTISFAPGEQVHYRFWRELDLNGGTEEIKAGDITVGVTDSVVSASYDIQP